MPNYLFLKKNEWKILSKFLKSGYLFWQNNNIKIKFKKLTIYRNAEIIGNTQLCPFHNYEPSPMPVGWKLWKELALKWPETSLFRSSFFITWIIQKLIGYPSKNCNYTSKKKFWRFPIPPGHPPVDNFFNSHLKKYII